MVRKKKVSGRKVHRTSRRRRPAGRDKVVFFRFLPSPGGEPGEVIAVFPDEPVGLGQVNSYMHVGQHGASNMDALTRVTEYVPLSPKDDREVADLWNELAGIGYKLGLHPDFYVRGQPRW